MSRSPGSRTVTARTSKARTRKQVASPVSMWSKRNRWWLLLILALGLALRSIYLAGLVDEPDFAQPGRDALYHDYWARAILSGDWSPPSGEADPEIRTTPYMRAPGYAWFLAGAYGLTGSSYLGARLLQIALGLVNILLAAWVGRRLFGPGTGIAAAALTAVYWIFIYYEGELHAPVLAVGLTLGVLGLAGEWVHRLRQPASRSWLWLVATGLCLGALCLVRPNAVLVAPVLAAWVVWNHWARGERGPALKAVATLTLATLLIVLPVTIRNAVAADDPVLISSTSGLNLYLAHHPDSDGVSSILPEVGSLAGLSGWDCFDYPRIVRAIEAEEGRAMSHSEVSSYFARKAGAFIRDEPGLTAKWALRRAALFWGPDEVSNDEVVAYDRRHSRLLSWLPGFPLALGLGLLGLGLSLGLGVGRLRRARDETRDDVEALAGAVSDDEGPSRSAIVLLLGFAGAYFFSVLPTIAAARYRVPIVPILLLFAAYALFRIARSIRMRDLRSAVTAIVVGLGLWGLASISWVDYEPDLAAWHFNRAVAYQRGGNSEQAIAEYEMALEVEPGHLDALSNLGAALAAKGDGSSAIELYRRALAADPFRAEAHNNLGTALAEAGDDRAAIDSYMQALKLRPEYPHALNNLGLSFASLGAFEEAEEVYRRALAIDSRYERARNNLAALLVQRGTDAIRSGAVGEALEAFSEAADLAPNSFRVQADLASLLAQNGDFERLAPVLGRLESLDVDDPGAALRLAWTLATSPDLARRFGDLSVRLVEAVETSSATGSETRSETGAGDNPTVLSTRAAAFAAAGRFPDAIAIGERALHLARTAGDEQLVAALQAHLDRYRAGISLAEP